MYFVYILGSKNYQNKIYIGFTRDLKKRLKEHNEGKSFHTNRFKPWGITNCVVFKNKIKAERFEIYLKTASGKAFLRKRLVSIY